MKPQKFLNLGAVDKFDKLLKWNSVRVMIGRSPREKKDNPLPLYMIVSFFEF